MTAAANDRRPTLPPEGLPAPAVLDELRRVQARDSDVTHTQNFRADYWVGDEVAGLIDAVGKSVRDQNVLYAGSSFPSLRQIEADLVGAGLDLLNAPPGAVGTVTTGGSESNFMALKTARDAALARRAFALPPAVVLAHTAHPSIEKAAQMLGMRTRRASGSVDWAADVDRMAALVDDDTAMIVGSAPPAAYATVDPIPQIAAIARAHDLWMHVDGCMGGWFLPFAEAAGQALPVFDFRLPEVRSMSADLHKFGYAPKGASMLLLRDPADAAHRDYRFKDWPFGLYETTGVAGSRPALPLVAAWAVQRHLGRAGYLRIARHVIDLRKRLIAGINAIPGLSVIGRPAGAHLFVHAIQPDIDVFAVDEALSTAGYLTSRAWMPESIQLWVSTRHDTAAIDRLLADLARAVTTTTGHRALTREAVYSR